MTASRPDNETIFHAARGIPDPDRRRAYVREACGEDEARIAHIEALLAVADAPDSLLDPPAGSGPAATIDQPTLMGSGTVIGPYKLLHQIGEGGMGIVFMAEQAEPVRRKVALKVLKPGMDTRQVVARFEAERQALALMDHPSIARVFDGGTTPSGRPYFVMELVEGVPITEHCDRHRLTPRQRLGLFIHVAQAVQHAHQKGVIHRDLKPSNILVALYDGRPVPKVIDFGVAKAVGQQLTEKTIHTGFAQMVGTPLYMSPEQAGRSAQDVDTRGDVYSLGVLLYELLTGTTPFPPKQFRGADYDEIRRIIREEEPPRPSHRVSTLGQAAVTIAAQRHTEPKRLHRLCRGDLDWIVMKCLEKDRDRRYETANGLARDVERYLHDEPVQACPPSAWYRFRKFTRRNKGRLAVAAGVFMAVLVVAVSIGWAVRDRAARQAQAERRAREDFEVARTLIAENKLIVARQRLAAARAQLSGEDLSARASLSAQVEAAEAELDRLQRFRDRIDRAHREETAPVLEPRLAAGGPPGRAAQRPPESIGNRGRANAVPYRLEARDCYAVLERDDWDTALEGGLLGRDQVEQIRRTVYEELLWLAADLGFRGQEHRLGLKLSPEAAARAALVYLGKAERAYRPTHTFYLSRANCRKILGEEAAAQTDRQLADRTPPTLAVDHHVRGTVAYKAGQLAEAIQAFEAALDLEPTHYWSLMRLGNCLADLGQKPEDFAAAVRVFTGCILNRPDHAHAYHCRGHAYFKLGQYDKAVADCSRAVELDPKHEHAWYNRGVAYASLGQYDRAADDYETFLKLAPTNAGVHNALAWLLATSPDAKRLDPDRAVRLAEKAVQLAPKAGSYWRTLGVAHYRAGHWRAAVAALDRSVELRRGVDASDRLFLAMACWKLGKHGESREAYNQAVQWLEEKANTLGAVQAEELRRFRNEAEELLELKKK
jgi:serine/threonine protein kinase/tetratricopeptide (TPR) repeat protein